MLSRMEHDSWKRVMMDEETHIETGRGREPEGGGVRRENGRHWGKGLKHERDVCVRESQIEHEENCG